ncbi:MAG: flagellar filament capping protein FliD [Oscillospiraceae bacterium]|nr:flagellar filament capping protein FliD [Oscillospiraceae bacterium]
MRVSGGLGNFSGINNLFNTLHQGKVLMHANRLSNSRALFPENIAPGKGSFNSDAVGYVNDIKSAASGLANALKDLSGSAFNIRDIKTKDEDGNETVTRGVDTNRVKSAVNDMVKNYNNLFTAAAENTGDPKAQSLASRTMNIASAYSRSLSDIGIGFDNTGKMTVDEKKLDAAMESGKLQQFFTENTGRNFGFSASLGRLAENVSNNTSNFVSNTLFGNSLGENFSYSGFGNANSLNTMRSGSIFDFTF